LRKPMNAFMLWARGERRELLKLHAGVHNSSISILLGLKWNKMTENDKRPYYEEQLKLTKMHRE
ncbi:hypothetical protein HELRODRAFT_153504, partial [Helobdella robusta]